MLMTRYFLIFFVVVSMVLTACGGEETGGGDISSADAAVSDAQSDAGIDMGLDSARIDQGPDTQLDETDRAADVDPDQTENSDDDVEADAADAADAADDSDRGESDGVDDLEIGSGDPDVVVSREEALCPARCSALETCGLLGDISLADCAARCISDMSDCSVSDFDNATACVDDHLDECSVRWFACDRAVECVDAPLLPAVADHCTGECVDMVACGFTSDSVEGCRAACETDFAGCSDEDLVSAGACHLDQLSTCDPRWFDCLNPIECRPNRPRRTHWIAYQVQAVGGLSYLVFARSDGTGTTEAGHLLGRARWSADGAQIAFMAIGDEAAFRVLDFENGTTTTLGDVRSTDFAWLPNGETLVLVLRNELSSRLWLYDLDDGLREAPLTTPEGQERDDSPVVSNDGSTVYFLRWDESDAQLLSVAIAGGDTTEVAGAVGITDAPSLTPNGLSFAWSNRRNTQITDFGTRAPLRVGVGSEPSFFPDGTRLAVGSGNEILTYDIATGAIIHRTSGDTLHHSPVVSSALADDLDVVGFFD